MTHRLFGYSDSAITINLDAIITNWRYIDSLSAPSTKTAAMVKADGYGLGSGQVAMALVKAGCELFFVANLTEALELRAVFRQAGYNGLPILVLHGIQSGQEPDFAANQLVPVLNDLKQMSCWQLHAIKKSKKLPALLHFDTGMTRLGLDADQTDWLINNKQALDGLELYYVMSHLVSGEIVNGPMNAHQLARFQEIRQSFFTTPASLANSAGIMLGNEYHFSMTRPGIALYGIHPRENSNNLLLPTFDWQARIIQIRDAAAGDTVGYGGTYKLARASRIATLGVGYADGYNRQLGGKASVSINGKTAPVIGRVSMDSITVDVTDFTEESLNTDTASLIHSDYRIDQMASDVNTISYEIISKLGRRANRQYRGGG